MVKIIGKIRNNQKKMGKKIIFTFILLISIIFPKLALSAINDNNPSSNNNQNSNITPLGIGISISKKFELISGLADFDKSDDHIFFMPEVFYENLPDQKDKINEQFGAGINLGYGYEKFDIFASFGGLVTKFEYEIDQKIEDYHRGNFYYGVGLGYNFNKYLATRINAKFYKIEFTDRNNNEFHSKNNSITMSFVIKL
tara:strand:+ start:871 stop:1464 length:594 start_codon:yes stop_codon:yes gene_type:complete